MQKLINPFTYPTYEEAQHLLSDLPPETFKQLWNITKKLRDSKPSGWGLGLQFDKPAQFRSVKHANEHIKRIMEHLIYHRSQSHILEYLRADLNSTKRKLNKENREIKAEVELLKEENARLKLTIDELFGFKKKKKKLTKNQNKSEEEIVEDVSEKNVESSVEDEAKPPKKRGAPKGHKGNTRSADKEFCIEENVVPKTCSCGCNDIEQLDSFEEVIYEDIKVIVEKTLKRYFRGKCKSCGKEIRHDKAAGPPVRIGENASVLFTLMRQNMGTSFRKLSTFASECFNFKITQAGMSGIVKRVTSKLMPAYLSLQSSLREQKVIHADETGWKMDGNRWQLWTFCNDNIAFFHADKSRSRAVINKVLGTEFEGLVHADFYAAYNHLPNTQRCLIHLDRDISKEIQVKPDDKTLMKMRKLLWDLIEKGVELQQKLSQGNESNLREKLMKTLDNLCSLKSRRKVVKTLIKRINNHRDSLIAFVDYPSAEFHNNKAERAIRPSVIFRKISFGNRTETGAINHAILTTLNQTCKLQKVNAPKFFLRMTTAPPEEIASIVKEILSSNQG